MFLENALLLLANPARQAFVVEAAEGVDLGQLGLRQLADDDTLITVIREKKDAVLRYDLDLNPLYEGRREALRETFTALAAELLLPMEYKDQMRGIISLGRKKSGKMFTPEDLDLLKTLVNQSVIALENASLFRENLEKGRMEEELKIAHDLQTSMLPESAPEVKGYTIAARCIPAREVGGDFFDFIEMGGEKGRKLGIVVADVSGKAVSGALVMAATRSIFRVLSTSQPSVDAIMNIRYKRLHQDVSRYEETRVAVRSGDTVIFYTDGIVEAMNAQGEIYGFDRLMASLEVDRKYSAHDLVEKIIAHVSEFVGGVEQHDDLTVVVLEVG
jgi:sigma-B regulation protein RsbU (phosphoserine phosphatase)